MWIWPMSPVNEGRRERGKQIAARTATDQCVRRVDHAVGGTEEQLLRVCVLSLGSGVCPPGPLCSWSCCPPFAQLPTARRASVGRVRIASGRLCVQEVAA
jgi:hypothetical protein